MIRSQPNYSGVVVLSDVLCFDGMMGGVGLCKAIYVSNPTSIEVDFGL